MVDDGLTLFGGLQIMELAGGLRDTSSKLEPCCNSFLKRGAISLSEKKGDTIKLIQKSKEKNLIATGKKNC